jgi:hypothetical protein
MIEHFAAAFRVLAIRAPGIMSEPLADTILVAAGKGAAQP